MTEPIHRPPRKFDDTPDRPSGIVAFLLIIAGLVWIGECRAPETRNPTPKESRYE